MRDMALKQTGYYSPADGAASQYDTTGFGLLYYQVVSAKLFKTQTLYPLDNAATLPSVTTATNPDGEAHNLGPHFAKKHISH